MSRSRDLDVLVVGEINPDIIVSATDPTPVFGQVERVVDAVRLTIGSSSAIFACAMARLGLRTAIVGVVGDDALGRFMLESLAAHGIDVSACQVDPVQSTGASVILTRGGDRAILTATGTIGTLDVRALPVDLVGRARHVHVGAYFLQRASWRHLPAFFRRAQLAGLTTSVDCNWDPSGRWDRGLGDLLPFTDVFMPNAAEALHLTGRAQVDEAARDLARRRAAFGPETLDAMRALTVAVKCGAKGAIAIRGEEVVTCPALPVNAVDATGAGDTFDAGFVFAWLSGLTLTQTLEFAVACGSLSTERIGGTEGQPTVEQVRAAFGRFAVDDR